MGAWVIGVLVQAVAVVEMEAIAEPGAPDRQTLLRAALEEALEGKAVMAPAVAMEFSR